MKILNGRDLADFIKERQARQVRALRQAHHVFPRLAIVQTIDSPVIDSYVRLKQAYGTDILIDVDVYKIDQAELSGVIERLNNDPSTHGIIIQLPLADAAVPKLLSMQYCPPKMSMAWALARRLTLQHHLLLTGCLPATMSSLWARKLHSWEMAV